MQRRVWIPLGVALAMAGLSGCDLMSAVVATAAGEVAGEGSGDPSLEAFLGDRAEPDEEAIEGVSGLAPIKLTRTVGIRREPAGDIAAGERVKVSVVKSPLFVSYTWSASGGTLETKGDTAVWMPNHRAPSAIKLTARTRTNGKAVLYLVAFTDGRVLKFREAVVTSTLPRGWLQANDPFKTASPSPAAPPSVAPSVAPAVTASAAPVPLVARSPENLGQVPSCGGPGAALSESEYQARWRASEASRDWAAGVCLMREAVRAYPASAAFHLYLAYAAAQLGAFVEAVPAIEKARELAPQDDWVLDHVGYVYMLHGIKLTWDQGRHRWSDGAYWHERATIARPSLYAPWAQLGIVAANIPDDARAYQAWKQAFALDPATATGSDGVNFKASCEWAIARLRSAGQPARAAEYAELAVQAFPAEPAFKAALADLYVQTHQLAKAEALLAGMPAGPDKEVLRGILKSAAGDPAGAEAIFAAVSRANPSNWAVDEAVAKFYRGKVEALPYTQQMASAHQQQVVLYQTHAVTKYFAANPYSQTRTYHAPLRGSFALAQGAGGQSFHYGIADHHSYDLTSATAAAPIYAVAAGTVKRAVYGHADRPVGAAVDFSAQPNLVEIDHGGGQYSSYLHLKQHSGALTQGQAVAAGAKIGEIGNTGISTGPHLHFALRDARAALPIRFTGLKQGSQATEVFSGLGAYSATGP